MAGMAAWDQPKCPRLYRDINATHPILLINSHQVDDGGRLTKKRYKTLVPARALVESNEFADKMCMMALGVDTGNLALATIPTLATIRYPPNTLRFTFSHLCCTCYGDTPTTIERQVRRTLIRAAQENRSKGAGYEFCL